MFIYNFKINAKRTKRILLVLLFLLLTLLFIWLGSRYFLDDQFFLKDDPCQDESNCNVTSDNYTDVLKIVHDDLEKYIRTKNSFYWLCISFI